MDADDITGMIIFWCYELLYLCRWLPGLKSSSMFPRIFSTGSIKRMSQRQFFGPHPSHFTELALGLNFAVEFPLIVAFHPSTQYHGIGYNVPFTHPLEVFTQFVILFAVEEVLKPQIHWYFPPCDSKLEKHSLDSSHSAACGLSIDYLLPRATLWLAIAAVGMASLLSGITGRLHMFSIVLWAVLRQFWSHHSLIWHYAPVFRSTR